MLATAEPNCCPFCGEPCKKRVQTAFAIAKRRQKGSGEYEMTCGEPECFTAYQRCYHRDYRGTARDFPSVSTTTENTP